MFAINYMDISQNAYIKAVIRLGNEEAFFKRSLASYLNKFVFLSMSINNDTLSLPSLISSLNLFTEFSSKPISQYFFKKFTKFI